ncbi:hypothetical protein BDV35DRAFT_260628 [Aspergillus flavus]|uniref:Uncharacterized protein n=1 Tax=Aspergillus flavus TaxID=5059 RepID=A0A5N6GSR8_ASPFL|nr:hypothetical protein BDV35DRAFT_260628 [Aspergillus flavus]
MLLKTSKIVQWIIPEVWNWKERFHYRNKPYHIYLNHRRSLKKDLLLRRLFNGTLILALRVTSLVLTAVQVTVAWHPNLLDYILMYDSSFGVELYISASHLSSNTVRS